MTTSTWADCLASNNPLLPRLESLSNFLFILIVRPLSAILPLIYFDFLKESIPPLPAHESP
jgi:hypothetical protein